MSEIETNHVDEPGAGDPQEEATAAQAEGQQPGAGDDPQGGAEAATATDGPSREQELEQELQKARDQLLRTAADYDNFRKRTRKDLEDAQRKGLERALLEVLPVADNLERALGAVDSTSDVTAVIEGLQMVLRSFNDSLDRLGAERVPAQGHPFDPNLHEAIQQVPTADAPPGTIVSELVPGYRLGGKLLRASMVAVAAAAPKNQDGQ